MKGREDAANADKTGNVTDVTDVTEIQGRGRAEFATLFDDVQAFLERFIAYPSPETATAHTLWVAHAHVVESFENTPRLAFLSPEPGSGKSRCMELTEALVPRAVLSVNASVAYIFRKIGDDAGLPTLLMDEIDAVFSGGKSDGNEDLRGLLNSGYRKGAVAGRAAVRGKEIITEEWPSFSAVALAGLNQLPDTLMTRSIIVNMKRRRQDQKIEPYRRRVNQHEAQTLYERLTVFADKTRDHLSEAWPELPDGIEDRDADIWEPLIAIADTAGGHWTITARDAAVLMVAESKKTPATLGIKLLADIQQVIGDNDRISTIDLLGGLHELEASPWASLRGEPIDSRFLARMLAKYDIDAARTIRIGDRTAKGYLRASFVDPWARYVNTPESYPGDPCDSDVDTVIFHSEEETAETAPPPASLKVGNNGNKVTSSPNPPTIIEPSKPSEVAEPSPTCPKHGTPTWQGMCGRCEAGIEVAS